MYLLFSKIAVYTGISNRWSLVLWLS